MTIHERLVKLGAEFSEVLCFSDACRSKNNMPKQLFMKHNGYGTRHYPPLADRLLARKKAEEHDRSHDIVIFFGRGR